MNALGLSTTELDLIRSVLRRHPAVTGAILFGSRAMGIAQPESDIDLALEGLNDFLQAEAIASELDELPLPYRFDVVALATAKSAQLRAHIERVGVRVYGKTDR